MACAQVKSKAEHYRQALGLLTASGEEGPNHQNAELFGAFLLLEILLGGGIWGERKTGMGLSRLSRSELEVPTTHELSLVFA